MTDPSPIFVVGAPRTGTTLMKEVLNGHPDVHLFEELHFFERIWDGRERFVEPDAPEATARAAEALWRVVADHGSEPDLSRTRSADDLRCGAREAGGGLAGLLAATLAANAGLHDATRWGDSTPQDVLYLDILLSWYPGARVVAMVRDPRGYLASYKNFHRRAMRTERERYEPLLNSLLWRSYMTALRGAVEAGSRDALLLVHYEALAAEPERTLREVCAHVGLDPSAEMLDVRRGNSSYAPGGRADGIFTTSRERWRGELSPSEQWLVERICRRPMEWLGYAPELSSTWPPSWSGLLRGSRHLPLRAFDALFRSRKPFRGAKLRRILSLLRV